MSNKPTALNLYQFLDNEMARMHELLRAYVSAGGGNPHSATYGGLSSSAFSYSSGMSANELYKRIKDMQDLMLKALAQHDPLIQEKVAEMALMGTTTDETKMQTP